MPAGGRRFGAGRPGWRRKCEDFLPLDIRQLKAHGRLRLGSMASWSWHRAGERLGSVSIAVDTHGLLVSYCVDGNQRVEQRIPLLWTPCRLGGWRAWLQCPECYRRRAVLYGVNRAGLFSCRRCMKLAYASETERPIDRNWRKIAKLEAKLGEQGEKPKWMRWATYERICTNICDVEAARMAKVI